MCASPSDRRHKDRFILRGCYVKAQAGGFFKSLFRSGKPRRLPLVNLSITGMQFLLNEPLERQTFIAMSVSMQSLSGPFKVKGHVVWSKKMENKNIWRIGVAFTKLAQNTKLRIERLEREGTLHMYGHDVEYT